MPSVASQALASRLTELGERAVANTGIDLVEVDLRGAGKARLLRVYIDKPGGVTHADCELVSGRFGQLLDDEDAISGEGYTLEVSSPGVERKLSKPRDFERAIGQSIRLSWRVPPDEAGSRETMRKLEGKLTGFLDGTLVIETTSGETVRVPLAQVQKANLKFDW
jgi:ribosome maturation factor RimP